MSQSTINQRLKFLIGQLSLSARAFSELIGESPTNTQNYIGVRQTEPRHDYLAKVVQHFRQVNAHWLLTGEGEPFVPGTPLAAEPQLVYPKAGKDESPAALALAEREIALLREQLASKDALLAGKDAIIAAKDETISLLREGYKQPGA